MDAPDPFIPSITLMCTLDEINRDADKCGLLELNKTLNFSLKEAFDILQEYRKSSRNIGEFAQIALIVVYSFLIGFGVFANLLVCFVVARKSQLHTPRNLYIVNLSISDMSMCIVCMPFTLIKILQREWSMGTVLCKLVPVLQGTNIMISIGTITMIALDRYFTIVRRHNTVSTRTSVIICIVSVWIFSILATSPLAYFQVVEPFKFQNVILYRACIEKWSSQNLKITFAVAMLLIQTVIPASVVGIVHARIASYLSSHAKSQTNQKRAERELKRNKRTTILLLGVAVLFLVSWLPLCLFSLLTDILHSLRMIQDISTENMYIVLAICHTIAMSSAISNPIVYGWLNSNIRQEFLHLVGSKCAAPTSKKQGDDPTTNRTALPTSTQRKSSPVLLTVKHDKSCVSPPDAQVDSFML